MRKTEPSGLYSRMSARRFSIEFPSVSSLLECEPTETYIFFPSWEKAISRVQCPPPRKKPPEGRLGTLDPRYRRSEEHTSELQSHLNLVCRLLLEKKYSIALLFVWS